MAQSTPSFIIVGAGYGGIATAIELARKGLEVEVYETVKELTQQGRLYHSVVA